MGQRTQYAPGTFCWTDLTTPDQDGAKAFYSALFGWEATDNPVGDGAVYSIMKLGGQSVAAISPQPAPQRDAGVPPLWNSYVSVDNADAALAKARELGATVHADAFDVLDAGRMGVVQDPQGAFFFVWQPQAHIGAALVNGPGMLTWNELASSDVDASAAFYGELFGWTVQAAEHPEFQYLTIRTADGNSNGGIRPAWPPGTPPHWLVYFGVENVETSVAKAGELGGTTIAGAMDIGVGKLAVIQDPQGAIFALFEGELDE